MHFCQLSPSLALPDCLIDDEAIFPVENSSKDSSKNRTRVVYNHTRILDEPTRLNKNLIQFVYESGMNRI